MASLFSTVLVFTLAWCSSPCSAQSIRKELRDKEFSKEIANYSYRIYPSRVFQLSWQPRVFLYKGLLTDEECDHLILLAQKTKQDQSWENNLQSVVTKSEANSGSLLDLEDATVSMIEERISAWTFIPKENGNTLQVMHLGVKEAEGDLNYFSENAISKVSEPLMSTVILYLSNVTQGGQILFPSSKPKNGVFSDCTKSDDLLRPIKGDAILFFSLHLSTFLDDSSYHARCPLLEGEMWYAIKFLHTRAIQKRKASSDGDECLDMDDSCPAWAASGECERNPVFMIGSPDYYGTCRKSCRAC